MKLDLAPYKNKKICVALSGGGDSMALLHYLTSHAAELSLQILAAHLEHGIRGERSKRDADFVKRFCAQSGVPLIFKSENCVAYAKAHKKGLEEGAREVRYRFFSEILNSGEADYICTAHHADDNAETLLFNLFRGSALTGAGGIAQEQGGIIRPMLGVPKEEITAYLKENAVPYVEDETNADTRYTRNFLRIEILPSAKKIFPSCTERLYSFSRLAREDDAFLYELARKECEIKEEFFRFRADLPRPLFLRACVLGFRRFGGEKDYTQANCEDVFALRGAKNGACVHLPFSLVAAREYGKIVIYRPTAKETAEIPFSAGEFAFGGKILKICEGESGGNNVLRLDGRKLPENCVIRARREGDVFKKFGGGTKKLKDFLIDKKIPVRERDSLPVIAKGSEIYAVCGVEISDKVKLDRESGRIYSIILQ